MLTLTAEMSTGNGEIDRHHADFVEALNAIDAVEGDDVLVALDRLIAHCEAHFAFENEQMEASHFPPIGCHLGEHEMVIETVREVRRRVAAGHPEIAGSLGPALSEWFSNHVQSMDAVLARYLAQPGVFESGPVQADATGCGLPA